MKITKKLIKESLGYKNEGKKSYSEKKQNIITKLFVNTYLDKNLIYQDLKKIQNIRKRNYYFFYNHLKNINMLKLKKRAHGPLYFPLLLKNGEKIRRLLNKKKIYTPILWKNLKRNKKFTFEYNLAKNCIFLPIDQRYNITSILCKRAINSKNPHAKAKEVIIKNY